MLSMAIIVKKLADEELMLKGINKNVIVIRADRGSCFEAVYFVVKKGIVRQSSDIIHEANCIVREKDGSACRRKSIAAKGRSVFLGFLIGAIFSSFVWALIISFTL